MVPTMVPAPAKVPETVPEAAIDKALRAQLDLRSNLKGRRKSGRRIRKPDAFLSALREVDWLKKSPSAGNNGRGFFGYGSIFSIRSVAKKWGVSKTTLHRYWARLNGSDANSDNDEVDATPESPDDGRRDPMNVLFLLNA